MKLYLNMFLFPRRDGLTTFHIWSDDKLVMLIFAVHLELCWLYRCVRVNKHVKNDDFILCALCCNIHLVHHVTKSLFSVKVVPT